MGSTEEEESGGEGDEPGVDTGGSRCLARQLCFGDDGDEGPERGGREPGGEGNGSGGEVQLVRWGGGDRGGSRAPGRKDSQGANGETHETDIGEP